MIDVESLDLAFKRTIFVRIRRAGSDPDYVASRYNIVAKKFGLTVDEVERIYESYLKYVIDVYMSCRSQRQTKSVTKLSTGSVYNILVENQIIDNTRKKYRTNEEYLEKRDKEPPGLIDVPAEIDGYPGFRLLPEEAITLLHIRALKKIYGSLNNAKQEQNAKNYQLEKRN